MAQVRGVLAARHRPPPPPSGGGADADSRRRGRTGRGACCWSRTKSCCACRPTDMLEQLGCFVAAVGSGEQALEMLDAGRLFDLLLTDLGLPGMSGEELAAGCAALSQPSGGHCQRLRHAPGSQQQGGLQFISSPIPRSTLQQALDHVAREGRRPFVLIFACIRCNPVSVWTGVHRGITAAHAEGVAPCVDRPAKARPSNATGAQDRPWSARWRVARSLRRDPDRGARLALFLKSLWS